MARFIPTPVFNMNAEEQVLEDMMEFPKEE